MCLPLMTEETAQDLVSHRESAGPFTQLGDVLAVESLTSAMFMELADYLTVRSYAFRVVADGLITGTSIRRRIECVVVVEEQAAQQTGAETEGGAAQLPEQPSGQTPGLPLVPLAGAAGTRSRQAPMAGGAPGSPLTPQSPQAPAATEQQPAEPPTRTVRIVYWRQ